MSAALIARINRTLAKRGEALRKSRSEREAQDFGGFYVIDVALNAVLQKDVDIDALAAELGLSEGGAA